MKVLSLREPFATLIKDNIKKIETRSWKTNYRGEIYIHASKTPLSKDYKERKELMKLVEGKELQCGKIICKCNLVDCVLMTEEYVNDIKNNNPTEAICGRYEVGRYAWILDNVEVLDNSIEAKGQLGIWNYKK